MGKTQIQQTEVQQEQGEFHERDGWYFRRMADGAVRIRHNLDTHVIDPEAWASIVSSVCERGETSATFNTAQRFHAGSPV